MQDVLIIGGSFAGLAAALQLGRARRQVTVLDTGENRNRYAEAAHNVLANDGTPPGDILAQARAQVAAYPSVQLLSGRAMTVSGEPDGFIVETAAGARIEGRRLILSYGIVDDFPALPGFAECWGKTVIHCPFCHGYEVAGRPWGIVYSSPMSLHAPTLYANWTDDLTMFLDGHELAAEEQGKLEARGVRLVEGKLSSLEHAHGALSAVRIEDGRTFPLGALYAHPRNRPSGTLHAQLGLDMKDTPTGTMVAVGEMQATSRAGVFAAGDLATAMHSVTFATSAGSLAAMGALQSLMV